MQALPLPRRALASLLLALAACGGSSSENDARVQSVQLQTTNLNPRVGETSHVGANPVDTGGITVQGVACGYVSSAPGVARVDVATGAVTAVSPGSANITATCGGKSATVAITVRPNTVRLTITKQGSGGGGVFANPPGSPDYEPGTSVQITASPLTGSTFVGWGGACAGTGTCSLVLNEDTTVTATFALSERFVSTTWNASMGSVTDSIGCRYGVSASGVLTVDLTTNTNGTVGGTGSTTAHINIVTTYSPPYTTCTALPFDTSGTGNVTGTPANLTVALASSGGNFTMTFNGARNGTTITGGATVNQTLRDGGGTTYPVSGGTGTFTATKQ